MATAQALERYYGKHGIIFLPGRGRMLTRGSTVCSYLAHVCLSWKRSYRYEETESFAKMCRFRGMQKSLALGHNRVPMWQRLAFLSLRSQLPAMELRTLLFPL